MCEPFEIGEVVIGVTQRLLVCQHGVDDLSMLEVKDEAVDGASFVLRSFIPPIESNSTYTRLSAIDGELILGPVPTVCQNSRSNSWARDLRFTDRIERGVRLGLELEGHLSSCV
ncbi:hypothetical protein SMJ63A_110089 [Stenotrophomonas geniculata]